MIVLAILTVIGCIIYNYYDKRETKRREKQFFEGLKSWMDEEDRRDQMRIQRIINNQPKI